MGEITDPLLKQSPSGRRRDPAGIVATLAGDAHGPSNDNLVSSISPAVGGPNIPLADFGQTSLRRTLMLSDDGQAESVFASVSPFTDILASRDDVARVSTTPAPDYTLPNGIYSVPASFAMQLGETIGTTAGGDVTLYSRTGATISGDPNVGGGGAVLEAAPGSTLTLENVTVALVDLGGPLDDAAVQTGAATLETRGARMLGNGLGAGLRIGDGGTWRDLQSEVICEDTLPLGDGSNVQCLGTRITASVQVDSLFLRMAFCQVASPNVVTTIELGNGVSADISHSLITNSFDGENAIDVDDAESVKIAHCAIDTNNGIGVDLDGIFVDAEVFDCTFTVGTNTAISGADNGEQVVIRDIKGSGVAGVTWSAAALPARGLIESGIVWQGAAFAGTHAAADALVSRRQNFDTAAGAYLTESVIV